MITRFPIQKGNSILADRLYGKPKGFDYIVGAGGDFVMRLKHKAGGGTDLMDNAPLHLTVRVNRPSIKLFSCSDS